MQVALRGGQFGVAHHVLDGDEVKALDREAAEAVAQVVEAAHPKARLLLGADEAGAYRRAIEWSAVGPAEDIVTATGERRASL